MSNLSLSYIVLTFDPLWEAAKSNMMDHVRAVSQSQISAVFTDLADHALVGMTVVLNARFLYANQKCCEVFGYSKEEFIQLSPLDLVLDIDRTTVKNRMNERLSGKTTTSEYAFRGLRKDGSTIDLEVRGTTIDIDGRPALVTSFVEMTDTRRAIQEREHQRTIAAHVARERDTAQRYLDVAGVMMMVFAADETISLVNRQGCEVLGYGAADELLGRNWIDVFIPAPKRFEMRAAFHSFLDGTMPTVEHFENEIVTASGEVRIISWHNQRLFDDSGKATGILSSGEDITDRRRAEEALRVSELRFRQIAENLSEVFWITNADKTKVEYVSPAYEAVWGRTVEEIYDRPISFLEAIVPEDREATERRVKQQAEGGYDVEYRIERPDGTTRWIHDRSVAIRDEADCVYRLIGVAEDITERKAVENRLYELAHFDQLTGVTNRFYFGEIVDAAIGRNEAGAVILLDLDGFKKVNDSAGHAVGDLLLRAAAKRLTEVAPPNATVCRWGGDEFAIFVPEGPATGSLAEIVRKVRAVCSEPFLLPRRKVFLTASIGIARSPDQGSSAAELMAHADLAMYRAKAEKPGTERFFSPEMKEKVQQEIDLEAELRRAFANAEFELHYQPQVDLATGRLVGAEALLRWRHPEKGLLPPAAFLPVLNQSPVAAAVGDWTVATASATAARLHRAGYRLRIGVNLFSAQMKAGGLTETIARQLQENELPPELLEIEITEKIILSQDPATLVTLTRIRELGVGMAFDDYGTGYASLSMLTEYPLTRLKIDRAFVARMATSAGDAVIVKAIVSLGLGFGLKLVAEGIETEEQAAALRRLGCHEGQGYLYGRAMPFNGLLQIIEQDSGRTRSTRVVPAA